VTIAKLPAPNGLEAQGNVAQSDVLLAELAAQLPGGGGVFAGRLLPARHVWAQLRRQARMRVTKNGAADFESRVRALDHLLKIETWLPEKDLDPVDIVDAAAAAVFLAVVLELMVGNPAVRAATVKDEVARWRYGAMLCASAQESPHRGKTDPELYAALELVEKYFDEEADLVDKSRRGVIGRSRPSSGLEDAPLRAQRRVQVLRVAPTMVAIYGSALSGTLASLINIARDLSEAEKIAPKDVEDWLSPNKKIPQPGIIRR
jgi:hypothetical protein